MGAHIDVGGSLPAQFIVQHSVGNVNIIYSLICGSVHLFKGLPHIKKNYCASFLGFGAGCLLKILFPTTNAQLTLDSLP